MIRLEPVRTAAQIADLARLAQEIWTAHYEPIIGSDQVAYMLATFQSPEAIAAQIADGCEYVLLHAEEQPAGYAALCAGPDPETLRLGKLYVHTAHRGRGLGKQLLRHAGERAAQRGVRRLDLTVNKHNADSIAWYERQGFRNVGSLVQDIGGGFVMDDYRMEKPLFVRADPPPDGSFFAEGRLVRLFVLTGQSNSLGTTADPGEKDVTPGADPLDVRAPFFWSNRSARAADGPARIYGDSGGCILPLQAQQGEGRNPLFWGPEIGFGRRLAAAGLDSFLLVKASRGGGGNQYWLKNSQDDHMYRHVVETVRAAVAALPAGTAFRVETLLYVQGESDAAITAPEAGERLRLLLANLREDLPNAAALNAVIGGICAEGPNRDIVRGQQAQLPSRDPAFRYVDTLDLRPLLYDGLHFNKAAKLELGRRMADAWLAAFTPA